MDKELEAIRLVVATLDDLGDQDASRRVLKYVSARVGLVEPHSLANEPSPAATTALAPPAVESLAELFERTAPRGEQEKALVMAYWFQEIQGNSDWEAQSVNTELKHLGHGLANVTSTLARLIDKRPQLVIQTRKSGSSRQARKKYRLTREGAKIVERLLTGQATSEE